MTLLDTVMLGTYRTHGIRTSSPAPSGSTAPRRPAAARGDSQLQRVGLAIGPFELAGNLPLGNQRLLEIARALAAETRALVLDEPAAGLRRSEKRACATAQSLRGEKASPSCWSSTTWTS